MESNGPDGQIGANGITVNDSAKVYIEGLSESFIKANILNTERDTSLITFGNPDIGYERVTETQLQYVTFYNEEASTAIQDLESVDSIRENAPNWLEWVVVLLLNKILHNIF